MFNCISYPLWLLVSFHNSSILYFQLDYGATNGEDGLGGGGGGSRSYNVGSAGAEGGNGTFIYRYKDIPILNF